MKNKNNIAIFEKRIVVFSIIGVLVLVLPVFFLAKRGTFSLEDDSAVTLVCPEKVKKGNQVTCQILVNYDEKIVNGIKANYDLGTGVTYDSFTSSLTCGEEDDCINQVTNEGFVIGNIGNLTNKQSIGELKVNLPSDATVGNTYKVGIKNIELSTSDFENVLVEDLAANIGIKSDVSSLSSLSIEGITLNEEFNTNTLEYTATVAENVETLTINATKIDESSSISGNIGEVEVKHGTNVYEIIVTAEDGVESTTYKITITRPYTFTTEVYTYNEENNYIYTRNDNGETIINNIEQLPDGLTYNINNGNLEIKQNDNVIKSIKIVSFTSKYGIVDKKIYISENQSYSQIMNNITSSTLDINLYKNNTSATDGDTIDNNYKIRFLYNNVVIDTYDIVSRYLLISNDLSVDSENKMIKKIVAGTTYLDFVNKIATSGTIEFARDNIKATDPVKTGDIVNIIFADGTISFTLSVLGDVSGDGVIDIIDLTKLYYHVKEKNIMTDKHLLSAGDIVADGSCDIIDLTRLYHFIKKEENPSALLGGTK